MSPMTHSTTIINHAQAEQCERLSIPRLLPPLSLAELLLQRQEEEGAQGPSSLYVCRERGGGPGAATTGPLLSALDADAAALLAPGGGLGVLERVQHDLALTYHPHLCLSRRHAVLPRRPRRRLQPPGAGRLRQPRRRRRRHPALRFTGPLGAAGGDGRGRGAGLLWRLAGRAGGGERGRVPAAAARRLRNARGGSD